MILDIKCKLCGYKIAQWDGERDSNKMMKYLAKVQELQTKEKLTELHPCGWMALLYYDVY